MAWGDAGSPTRFGTDLANTSDRELFAQIFHSEVLAAYTAKVIMDDAKTFTQYIEHGKSATFPKTWQAESEYMTAGQEMLGNDIDTTDITITVDGKQVSHIDIYDLDAKMSHFEVMTEFAQELGKSLARAGDQNKMRAIASTARLAATGVFPGGHVIQDAALAPTGLVYNGYDWYDAIVEAGLQLEESNVDESETFYVVVNPRIFDAIKHARAPKSVWNGTTLVTVNEGDYIVLNRDFNPNSFGISGFQEAMQIGRATVVKSNLIPKGDWRANSKVYSKYKIAMDTTEAVGFTRQAIGTVVLMDVAMEHERDVRRQSDFHVASMAVGHGALRPECAFEFRSGAFTTA